MRMLKQSSQLGFSVYPSTWMNVKEQLSSAFSEGSYVFTSLHIQEEANQEGYQKQAEEMIAWLKAIGYQIIADVSKRTLDYFQSESLMDLAQTYSLDVLRIDFGFSDDEIVELSNNLSICLNASTIEEDLIVKLTSSKYPVFAMHNFYPRPETGLDEAQFIERNQRLRASNMDVIAFIPSDENLRKPLFEGLPTLEKHRLLPPFVSFMNLVLTHQIPMVFIGDGVCSNEQLKLIQNWMKTATISLPVKFQSSYKYLYNQVFTIRGDSPKTLKRLLESRAYATEGEGIEPFNTVTRFRGSITMDNQRYQRYSGEIQIPTTTYAEDDRVNVIGMVDMEYINLLDDVVNQSKIKFVRLD